jgi:hypothetical protein
MTLQKTIGIYRNDIECLGITRSSLKTRGITTTKIGGPSRITGAESELDDFLSENKGFHKFYISSANIKEGRIVRI